ncbi:MAG: hypothetical protein NTW29_01800 [Bacteroidetes bacterium]|nr:hypothetical protein [Bacteroidota bacterium]
MKTTIKTCGLVFVITFLVIACQKNEDVNDPKKQEPFNAKTAKDWYYATFKKSAEWASSPDKGKKLPDWEHSSTVKFGSYEAVVFPLVKARSRYPVSSVGANEKLSQEELIRIANASTSRIAFIKQTDGRIVVREFEYIPDWSYLAAENFDIGKTNLLAPDNNFSGRVFVRNWGGDIVSMAMQKDGKTQKRGKIKKANSHEGGKSIGLTEENCFEQEFCVWQQDCTLSIYSDGMITQECTNWYNTGECWMEAWCTEGGDPCELAGLGCGGDDDGGGEGPDCDARQLESEGVAVSEQISSQLMSQTPVTRTKKYHWVIYKQNQNFWKFISHEAGVHVKTNSTINPWKWQSLEHVSISKEGAWSGGEVDCTLNTSDTQLGLYWSSIELNYTITASAICRGFPIGGSSTHTSAKIIGINE